MTLLMTLLMILLMILTTGEEKLRLQPRRAFRRAFRRVGGLPRVGPRGDGEACRLEGDGRPLRRQVPRARCRVPEADDGRAAAWSPTL